VASPRSYRPVFAEGVAEFLVQQPRRRQRRILDLANQLARHPFVRSDYTIPDESGRPMDHLMIEDYVFTYWVDHGSFEVRITDIDDAS